MVLTQRSALIQESECFTTRSLAICLVISGSNRSCIAGETLAMRCRCGWSLTVAFKFAHGLARNDGDVVRALMTIDGDIVIFQFSEGHRGTCPNVVSVVLGELKKAYNSDEVVALGVFRLQSHGCFVRVSGVSGLSFGRRFACCTGKLSPCSFRLSKLFATLHTHLPFIMKLLLISSKAVTREHDCSFVSCLAVKHSHLLLRPLSQLNYGESGVALFIL